MGKLTSRVRVPFGDGIVGKNEHIYPRKKVANAFTKDVVSPRGRSTPMRRRTENQDHIDASRLAKLTF